MIRIPIFTPDAGNGELAGRSMRFSDWRMAIRKIARDAGRESSVDRDDLDAWPFQTIEDLCGYLVGFAGNAPVVGFAVHENIGWSRARLRDMAQDLFEWCDPLMWSAVLVEHHPTDGWRQITPGRAWLRNRGLSLVRG
jgi:hypothetical protein